MAVDTTNWHGQARNLAWNNDFTAASLPGLSPSPAADNIGSPMAVTQSTIHQLPYNLTVTPLTNKSRVETQIPVILTMHPFPLGVTKLHLQAQTISKAKLLAKDTVKTPDTLEVFATVVCTSAMQKPQLKQRALDRAAGLPETPIKLEALKSSTEDGEESLDLSQPLNGADVKICNNCINRERKRAARKKAKRQEDEDHWARYESERIVVFNTSEYKNWATSLHKDGHVDSSIPDGAKQVDIPMRIACYCRHQSEKIGFQ
jgi:uncharacterized protein